MNEYDALLGQESEAANEYDDILRQEQDERAQAQRSTMLKATSTDPDQFAKAREVGDRLGIPPDVVARNWDETQRQDKLNEYDQVLTRNPKLAETFRDEDTAKLAHDDLGVLERVQLGLTNIFEGTDKGIEVGNAQIELARIRSHELFGGTLGEQDLVRIGELKEQMHGGGEFSGAADWFHEAGKLAPQLWESLKSGAYQGTQGAIAGATAAAIGGQLGPQVALPEEVATVPAAALTGFGIGMRSGAAQNAFVLEAGLAYDEFLDFKDENGQPLEPEAARIAALAVGGVNAALEYASLKVIIQSVPGGDKLLGRFTTEGLKTALRNPSIRKALTNFAKNYGKVIATETATEVAQEAVTMLAGELAKASSGGHFKAIDAQEVGERLVETAVQTAKAITILGVPGPGANFVGDVRKAQAAEASPAGARLDQAVEAARESKLRERAPEKFRAAADKLAGGRDVYLSADDANELFQSAPEIRSQIAEALPDVERQIAEAMAAGTDIKIPVADYLTHIAPDFHESFTDFVRFSPDQMSVAEARRYKESGLQQEFEAEVERSSARMDELRAQNEGVEQVYQDVTMQLVNSGKFSFTEAQASARQMAAVFSTLSTRYGAGDPVELYQKFGPQIIAQHSLLSQRQGDELDVLIGNLRAPRPKSRDLYGSSLLEFFAMERKGLLDDGGELSARDAQLWHRDRGGRRKLVREDGESLDSALEAAMQHGYLPQGSSTSDLLNLIDQELAGEQVYAEGNVDRDAVARQDALEALHEELARELLDVETATDEELRAALEAIMEGRPPEAAEEMRTLFHPAYHGTPHAFDRFSLDAIGTGEGAQAYGWGLYFASRKDVAEFYRRNLSRATVDPDNLQPAPEGSEADRLVRLFINNRVLSREDLEGIGFPTDDIAFDENGEISVDRFLAEGGLDDAAFDIVPLQGGGTLYVFDNERSGVVDQDGELKAVALEPGGHLYEVELTPQPDEYLDWDKPLSEQSDKVKAALEKVAADLEESDPAVAGGIREGLAGNPHSSAGQAGRALYRVLQGAVDQAGLIPDGVPSRSGNAAMQVSKALLAAGIPGIRYLDGSSRGKGEGAHNYVIFDDSLVQIRSFDQSGTRNSAESVKRVLTRSRILELMAKGETEKAYELAFEVFGQDIEALDVTASEFVERLEKGAVPMEVLTLDQSAAPATDAFREWFGDSKVVDENGEPLVVYHGSPRDDIEAFDSAAVPGNRRKAEDSIGAFWFTDTEADATEYSAGRTMADQNPVSQRGEQPGKVYSVHLRIENPLVWKDHRMGATVGDRKALIDQARDEGRDGVIIEFTDAGGEVVDGREFVVFNPEQIKSADNRGTFDPKDPRILYQSEPTLLAQHALSLEKLIHADRMGGLPVPSVAITDVSNPLDRFGEITLIAPPDMVDPRADRTAKVFGADAYTPRYPSVTYEMDWTAGHQVEQELAPQLERLKGRSKAFSLDEIEEKGRKAIEGSAAVALAHLERHGKKSRLVRYPDGEVNMYRTAERLSAQAAKLPGWQEFVDSIANRVIKRERIFNGFTYGGNRRYLPHDLNTVVKILKKGLRDGEGFNYGVGSIRAVYTEQFRSLKAIQKAKGRLVGPEEFTALKEEVDAEFVALADRFRTMAKHPGNSFGFLDAFSEHLKEMAERHGIRGTLAEYYDMDLVSDEDIEALAGFLHKLRDFPTEYFEAKIQRAVGLNEFTGAAVPKGKEYDRAVEILKDHGVTNIRRYKKNDNADRQRAIAGFKRELFQRPGAGKRGSITFPVAGLGTTKPILTLFERADLSTFLHESGHLYLEIMRSIAEQPDAPQVLLKDLEAIKHWWIRNTDHIHELLTQRLDKDQRAELEARGGAEYVGNFIRDAVETTDPLGQQIAIELHEYFARGYESYLAEGSAPSLDLKGAFQRFTAWLKAIYRNMASLNVNLDEEIRSFFDRLLAADEEIQAAHEAMRTAPVFKDATEAGMSPEEWQAYNEAVERARREAEEELERRTLAHLFRKQKESYKRKREKLRAEVEAEINQRREYQAIHFLMHGEALDGELPPGTEPLKLDRAAIEADQGPGLLKLLPGGFGKYALHRKEGGVHPDVVAEMFGYGSGDEMLRDFIQVPKRQAAIEAETDRRMQHLEKDPMVDGTLAEEAIKALHNDERGKFLATELRVLSRRAGRPGTPANIARELARERIAKTKVIDITAIGTYRAAELRAAREAERATLEGNWEEAARQKRAQLFNHYLHLEAQQAMEEVDKAVRYLKKFDRPGTRKNLDVDYLDQIDALLARFDLRSGISRKAIERRNALAEWVEERRKEGLEVVVPERLVNEAFTTSYKELSIAELRDLRDAVKNIEHIARLKKKLLTLQAQRDFNEVVDELVDTAVENNTWHPEAPDYAGGRFARFRDWGKQFLAEHVKMEFLFHQLDGNKPQGAFWRYLFKPLADAEAAEQRMMESATARLNELLGGVRRRGFNRKVWVKQLNASFTKDSLLALALNWGNEGNRLAIVEQEGLGWTAKAVQEALNAHLTAEDWQFVQGVWDLVDSYWPEIAKLQRELSGVVPEKIDPMPVRTPFGTLRGGYYPLKYDTKLNFLAFKREEKAATQELFGSNWLRPATRQGHTKERVGSAGQKVKLDLSVAVEHVNNVIHDITHRKAIIDVDRLAQNKKVREAIEATAGRETYRMIRPWLANIAGDRREPSSSLEHIMRHLRIGGTIVNMGWKVTTAIVQPLGYLQSVELLGEKYAWIGAKRFLNPLEFKRTVEFVRESSTMMRNRQKTFDRDVRDAMKRLKGPEWKRRMEASFFSHIGLFDMAVSIPTWVGAYEKAMAETPDHEAAVAYADSMVRMSQSAGGAKDLAHIQQGSELKRLFTMFYSYFSVLYNLIRRRVKITEQGQEGVHRLMTSFLYLIVLPSVLSELIVGRGPDDDDDENAAAWAFKTVAAYPFTTMVGVRDVASGLFTDYGYGFTPVAQALETVVSAGKSTADVAAGEANRTDLKNILIAGGYLFHIPMRQLWLTAEGLYDLGDGEDVSAWDILVRRERD